ncbi:MAG TPA: cytochrome c3 family protein [Usitatibacter sp.]|nr:cytochrome c3 family protein [Usitatibacter sp.]
MKLLVIQQGTRGGLATQSRKTVVAEWIRVGRNASCEIHLPDPRIALEQGMIVNRDGPVYLEGEAGREDITRKSVRSVRLTPGAPLDIGPYRLEALPAPAGFDGAVKVDLVRPLAETPALESRASLKTLASIGMSKRGAAWLGLLVILAACLAIPAGDVLHLPWGANGLDRQWNPGGLMLAHQPIENRCGACHQVAFLHVKDRACLECHAKVGHHVAQAMQPAALFAGERCASCHKEHKGPKALHRDDDGFCVACHRDLGARAPRAQVLPVSDFAKAHPAFQLSIGTGPAARRERQDRAHPLVDDPGLAFPHAKHLDPAGVKSPTRGRVALDCASCHKPDASRRMFEPVSMARDCQECHRLEIEPAVTQRQAPHGDPAAAVAMIDEFYASLALNGVSDSFQKAFGVPGEGLLRRVGEPTPAERENALRLASRKARAVAIDLVEVRVCKTCHQVARKPAPASAPPAWSVAPVRTSNRWMPHARFDHAAHAQSKCQDCHDVAKSKSLHEVAMPTIETCRECHGGSRPQTGKVTSNCLLCHDFHDARHPWDPSFVPSDPKRVVQEVHAR